MILSLIAACLRAVKASVLFAYLSSFSQFDDSIVSNMIYLALPLRHLLSQWPSNQSCCCFSPLPPPPHSSCSFSSLKLKGNPRRACCRASAAWNHVDSPCCFLVSAHFDTRRSVLYAPLAGSIPGSLICKKKKSCTHSFGFCPFHPLSPSLSSPFFFSSLISLFRSLAPVPTLLCSL